MSELEIRDVRAIITHPPGARTLTVVKVETDEPELYGLGCASFCTRPTAVAAAVDDYLNPFLTGKDPGDIEDIWQSCCMSSYWRNGPVLNNALSGVDQALLKALLGRQLQIRSEEVRRGFFPGVPYGNPYTDLEGDLFQTHRTLTQVDAEIERKLDRADAHGAYHIGQLILETRFFLGAFEVIVMLVDSV